MITIASEGLSLCSDMIYTGSGINVLNDSFVRMGVHELNRTAPAGAVR